MSLLEERVRKLKRWSENKVSVEVGDAVKGVNTKLREKNKRMRT